MRIEAKSGFKHKMVELKARVDDHDFLRNELSALGAERVGAFRQTDSYFVVPEGRLKLREVEDDGTAELIYYDREDVAGPKSDDAFILRVKEPEELKEILKKILAPLVVVEKVREIYMYKGTQIHLDTVKKLGKFIEFERPTSDDPKRIQKDRLNLEKLMKKLKINPTNLEPLSYSDLIQT
ncbi:MAG TPA: CYTH domain-containing protein [Candidatus Bathyarchaeota archaeon]|nr:CYTH domain-containing protein [Candidatus Bathyarchaeota archaeon]